MNKTLAIGIGILLLIFLVLFSTTYTVAFHELAIRQRFGHAASIDTEPGLKLKLPIFADQVTHLDKRMQLIESSMDTVPTADGQQMLVRAFLLWRIDTENERGPQEFHARYRTIENASAVISDRFKTALVAGLSRYRFGDIVGSQSRMREAEEAVRRELALLRESGVEPVSVGVSQILLPTRTAQAVLGRMEATRNTLAEAERYKGNAEAERIESEARAMADKILAFATQRAEEIRAQGNEEAARYMAQMAEDPELAIFLTHRDALEAALSQRTTFVLEADYAPWHLMRLAATLNERGIPQPNATKLAEEAQRAAEQAVVRSGSPAPAATEQGN
jgi:modulator of FtsH protease HflC